MYVTKGPLRKINSLLHLLSFSPLCISIESSNCTCMYVRVPCNYTRSTFSIIILSRSGSVVDPAVGDIITGQVRQVVAASQSVVMGIHSGLGRVDITDISDHYLEEPLQRVAGHVGDLVK